MRVKSKNQIVLIKKKTTRCCLSGRKRFEPTIVVGDTFRRAKRAADECVGPGTFRWEIPQDRVVCASAGYIDRIRRRVYPRAGSFVFDHVCARRSDPNYTVVAVASPSHAFANVWSKKNCTYASRITASQARLGGIWL